MSAFRAASKVSSGRRLGGRTAIVTAVVALASSAASSAFAAQAPVGLGTADRFAVLAGTGITNTGPTTIRGDVGTFPTPTETGFGSVTLTGTNHRGDAVTHGAKRDLVTAYNDAAGRTPTTSHAVELGGSTLRAGVYTSGTFGLTGTLTLDARGNPNAEFIFKAGSTVITEADSRVVLLNGANPCRVVWQVGSSATFKTRTHFVGDVLALTSITAQTGATFRGRLLARNGKVTLDTNTITRSMCAATTVRPSTSPTPSAGASTGSKPSAGAAPGTQGSTGTGSAAPPQRSSTPTPPPSLAFTGQHTTTLVGVAVALFVIGTLALVAGRRRTVAPVHLARHRRS